MKLNTLGRTTGAAAAVLALSVSLAACGSDDDSSDTSSGSDNSSSDTSSSDGGSTDAGADTFGDGCSSIPTSGDGSFDGMVQDPVATAASNNPLLKTLTAAVGAAQLTDTLNDPNGTFTVFAPTDDAFAALPEKTLNGLLAGAKKDGANSDLAKILTHHVLGENDDPEAVVGEHDTVNGDTLTIEGDTSGMTVSDGTVKANVLCGNIPTANATVYVIDSVMAGAKL